MVLREQVAKAQQVAEMVRRHTQCIVDAMHRKMEAKVRELDKMMSGMKT